MIRSFQSPARYLQGPGILDDVADPLAGLGADQALVVGGSTALSTAREPLFDSLQEAGVAVLETVADVSRCSPEQVDDCVAVAEGGEVDVVVGVGGGHALDTAKAVSRDLDSAVVTVPTVASTDAPCSAIAALYAAADGAYLGIVHRERNPELVVVDTQLVADAPTRFLRYGMADAFATRFEAEAVASNPEARTVSGGEQTDAGLICARRCHENLVDHGSDALAAVKQGRVTPAVETIVETNTLLSGVGFESGGLAAAHAYQEGFTRAGVDAPHGTVVGIGTIAQLVLEDRPREALDDALDLAYDLEFAATLDELGVDETTARRIAEHACAEDTPMRNEPVEVTEAMATDALLTADELLRSHPAAREDR